MTLTPERLAEIEKKYAESASYGLPHASDTILLVKEVRRLRADQPDVAQLMLDVAALQEQLSDAQEAIAANDQNSVLAVTLQNQLNDAQSALRVKDDALQTCLNRMAWVQDVERRTSGTSWEALADAIAIATAALQPGRE